MPNRLRKMFNPTREDRIEFAQGLLNAIMTIEYKRNCVTCRNKIETYYDQCDGYIYKCDLMGVESIVNGHPLDKDIESCPYWAREPDVYEMYRKRINQEDRG